MTPPGAPPHDVPQPHALLMRTRDWSWWRPLLGLLLFAVLYGVSALLLGFTAAIGGLTGDLLVDLTDAGVLLLTNVSLIVAIPMIWLCWLVPHGLRIGWSSSVLGRLRWRLFVPLTWRALASLGLAVALTVLISVLTGADGLTGPASSFGWLVLVVLFTTPLQAAAEEYVFRGYLSQAIAGWIGRPRAGAIVAAVVTAVLFSLAHAPPGGVFSQAFLYRFAIGLAFSAAVWLTGGLEAAIVLHAVNNVVVFLLGGLLGGEVAADATGLLGWGTTVLGVVGMAGFVVWVAFLRERLHPELLSPALDLRGARPVAGPPLQPPFQRPFPPPAPSWGPVPYSGPGPGWYPPPGLPAPRRGGPPPDERWARPPADQGQRPGSGPGSSLGGEAGRPRW
ncbi:CPBP family intramembrane glutamic endopeptidase [Modestobacter sp. DSM 44400]|uniref:CPBP family intramembrane glutamic endopeptidase n=1 Tax=Modestobacter sp. DSM 44400 TaxID=1550230 RepID=UPI001587C08E|nr:type II CAAX endopeptidase family protein [Modestobacter sp. DSM 44400]